MESNDVVSVMDIVSLLLLEKEDGSLAVNFQFNEDLLNNLGVNAKVLLENLDLGVLRSFSEHVFLVLEALIEDDDRHDYIKA
jgi:small nuclear ribonucleoprotein (snRNP)-like protein